jgi:hypothetical protein
MLIAVFPGCSRKSESTITDSEKYIDLEGLKSHTSILGSDEFMGRKPCTEGEEKTIQYLKDTFVKLGLAPGNMGSYFQEVPLVQMKSEIHGPVGITYKNKTLSLEQYKDGVFLTRNMIDTVRIENSEMVFAGFGIVAPEYNWNDYRELDVKDKFVMVLVNDPGFYLKDSTVFKGETMTYYGRWTYKYEEAARQGARI